MPICLVLWKQNFVVVVKFNFNGKWEKIEYENRKT